MQTNNDSLETPPKQSWVSNLSEFTRFASIVILLVLGVRLFVAQPFIVSGSSMVPTFANSNYLIVDQLSYYFQEPKRGDVVIFHPPIDPKEYYIKRIIGVPGDTISVRNGVVTLTNAEHPEGKVLEENYITKDTLITDVTTVVTEGNYFVMGDNRPASYDSRKWGLLPKKNLVGRAFLRLFPLNRLTLFPGERSIN